MVAKPALGSAPIHLDPFLSLEKALSWEWYGFVRKSALRHGFHALSDRDVGCLGLWLWKTKLKVATFCDTTGIPLKR